VKQDQAKALGKLLKDKRLALGYSTYQLAEAASVTESTVVRLEQGRFRAPRPDKLARFAEALGISLADLYAKAGYIVPADLPSFDAYLNAKYPGLPAKAIAELTAQLHSFAKAHRVPLNGHPPTPKRRS
jgi:transcriptional regulator with XRE-family HTH domain